MPRSVTSPRFSVVVPAGQDAERLAATLRSLSEQDFAGPVEVIVVDSGAGSDTEPREGYGLRVVTEVRPGLCRARQTGTAQAAGVVVVSTDAGTLHPRNWLRQIDARLHENPDAVSVAGPATYVDTPVWDGVIPRFAGFVAAKTYARFGQITHPTHANLAFVRASFPGYDLGHTDGDDTDFVRRLRHHGPIVWDASNPVVVSSLPRPRRIRPSWAGRVAIVGGVVLAGLVGRAVVRRRT